MQQQQTQQDAFNLGFTRQQHEYEDATVRIKYPKAVKTHSRSYQATITVIPKYKIYNSPIEVEIRGFSCLHNFENIKSKRKNQFEMTESCLIEDEDKIEAVLVNKDEEQTNEAKTKTLENKSKSDQNGHEGEYFLDGSLILFQLDQQDQERLESLMPSKRYEYPIEFTLPPNLPTSLESLLLKSIHVSIKYTVEIKFSFCRASGRKGEQRQLILSFEMIEEPKVYPFQELVVTQDIRFYHENGRKDDQFLKSFNTCLLRCLCPNALLGYYISKNRMYNSMYENYDLYHLQLLAAVSKDQSIYLTVRAFKDPDHDQLTQNREKKNKDARKVENISLAEVAPDISLASIKHTERKPPQSDVQKVEVTMMGEITNLCKQTIFQKMIYLTHANYDMAEGECLVQLKDYLQYTKSCHNELFSLRYTFLLKAFFQEDENGEQNFETFVAEEQTKELVL